MTDNIKIGGKKALLKSLRNELQEMKNKLNMTINTLDNISDMTSTASGWKFKFKLYK